MTGVALALLSGLLVGFSLGLVGGGGSILATPLLLYVVGVVPPHTAIGTGAVAVAANAYVNLIGHARRGNVRWRSASIFAGLGAVAAWLGSVAGKSINGDALLFLFGCLMVVVGGLMLRRRTEAVASNGNGPPTLRGDLAVAAMALVAGAASGFFGIGGGFLIVPALIIATGMPTVQAVGSSLLAVGSFGTATAVSYAWSGFVDWQVAAEFLVGGVCGGLLGTWLGAHLSARKGLLNQIFAGLIFAVAAYVLYRSSGPLWP